MRPSTYILLLSILSLLSSCSEQKKEAESFRMEVLQPSWLSANLSNGPVSYQGSLVIQTYEGKTKAEIIHIAKGNVKVLGTVEFNAGKHTSLLSTATLLEEGMDISFLLYSSEGSSKGIECNLGIVKSCSRTLGQTINNRDEVTILYRIEREQSSKDKWKANQEATLKSITNTTKEIPIEYIVLVTQK